MSDTEKVRDASAKQVFTTGEAAELCNVSQQTIIRCFDSGRLNGFRVPGSRFRRIPRIDLIRFMRANDIPHAIFDSGILRVLAVDDDPIIIRMLEDLLGNDDRFELRTAVSGYEAGMMTKEFRPDVILLDYMLPDINGNIVCERIKSDSELKDTRIIIISGVVRETEIKSLLDAGAEEFISKPFSASDLVDRILAQATV
jgi:excisionase family DNA binding protein